MRDNTEVPEPTAHCMLEALAGVSNDVEHYIVVCGLVRHMLHPQTRCRATIKEALQSQLLLTVES